MSTENGYLKGKVKRTFSGFTLAELIVVVVILLVLATVGFLALSGYRDDAEESRIRTNVRSVYSAISAESASTGNSPRYYVVHDPSYSLTGGAVIVFDGTPTMLAGGDWNAPNTNYSAGNPDYAKLRLNPEKFKISTSFPFGFAQSVSAADAKLLLVGALDIADKSSGKSVKVRSYSQVAAVTKAERAAVAGDFPTAMSGSVVGLIRDVADSSSSGALLDGAKTGSAPGCSAGTVSGYSVPALSSGQGHQITESILHGSLVSSFSCSFGALSLTSQLPSCQSGYVGSGNSCVQDVCGGSAPGTEVAHAESNAASQSVSGTWHYSETPGLCTFACLAGHTWDGNACRASCALPVTYPYSGNAYALSSLGTVLHSASASRGGTYEFGASPSNGTLTVSFQFSCNDGALSAVATPGSATCQQNYAWNSNWTAPDCSANQQTFTCAPKPATTEWNTVSSFVQTWDGSAWIPTDSVTDYSVTPSTTSCRFKCPSQQSWNGASCVANSWSTGSWGSCSGETGSWAYSAWGACTQTCGGGTQTRTASCTRNANGTQSRTVQCLKYDGTVLADAECGGTKPSVGQSCSQGTDSVCGTATLSQACNTQSCAVPAVCNNSVQYACSVGTSSANSPGTCGGSSTWTCLGIGGGANASCSKANAACTYRWVATMNFYLDPYYGSFYMGTVSCVRSDGATIKSGNYQGGSYFSNGQTVTGVDYVNAGVYDGSWNPIYCP